MSELKICPKCGKVAGFNSWFQAFYCTSCGYLWDRILKNKILRGKDNMIYTSYFAKLKSLPDNIVPISICAKAPDWYKGLQYKKLAPKYDFFMKWKENHDNDYYTKCFNEQVLDKLDILTVIRDLMDLTEDMTGKNICLICFEKPTDFCHRHLVADWLTKNGFQCEEYKF